MTIRRIMGLYLRARINSFLHPDEDHCVYVNSTTGPLIFATFSNGRQQITKASVVPDTIPEDWSKDGEGEK